MIVRDAPDLGHVEAREQLVFVRTSGDAEDRRLLLLGQLVSGFSERLRLPDANAHLFQVFVTTGRFAARSYANASAVSLPEPMSYTSALLQAALACLQRVYRSGYAYKRAGVLLLELVPEESQQVSLFDAFDSRRRGLMKAVDATNRRYGRGTVCLGTASGPKRWAMKQDQRSPRYTTCADELPVLYAREEAEEKRPHLG